MSLLHYRSLHHVVRHNWFSLCIYQLAPLEIGGHQNTLSKRSKEPLTVYCIAPSAICSTSSTQTEFITLPLTSLCRETQLPFFVYLHTCSPCRRAQKYVITELESALNCPLHRTQRSSTAADTTRLELTALHYMMTHSCISL